MEKFTNSAYNRDAVSFKDAFEETLASKVFDALEAKKLEVAQNIFNGEVEIKEHGNDGFGSNKTSGNVTKGWPSPKHPGQGLPKTKEHKMEEAKMCSHCEKSMSKCSCEHMEEEVEQIDEAKKKDYGWVDTHLHNIKKHSDVLKKHGYDWNDAKNTKKSNPKSEFDTYHQKTIHHVTVHNDGHWTAHTNSGENYRRATNFTDRNSVKTGEGHDAESLDAHLTQWKKKKDHEAAHPIKTKLKSLIGMKEEVEQIDEGMHKHEKKHGKMHHKLAKKMMKLAHKHAKKHNHEEEEE
jgi:hypothetical protein